MTDDIQPILNAWPYRTGDVQVRLIDGLDGRRKIQLRIELGLLQMELDGRPDGIRPSGFESLLHYHRQRLQQHREQTGADEGFELSPDECAAVRQEALQYYYRYLACMQLGDYVRVVRDTTRNLDAFDLLRDYAASRDDRVSLEQYRPYVIMMQTRARALLAREEGREREALALVLEGIEAVRAFLESVDRADAIDRSPEIAVLRSLSEEIIAGIAGNPLEHLRDEMQRAVSVEDYERAALIRDEIRRLEQQQRQAESAERT